VSTAQPDHIQRGSNSMITLKIRRPQHNDSYSFRLC
jgi:hypothetical protein